MDVVAAPAPAVDAGLIRLKCVENRGKLRIRVITPGYNQHANCQFPRNLRALDREYTIPITDLTFAEGPRGKFFYRVSKRNITIVDPAADVNFGIMRVFGDDDPEPECSVCLVDPRDVVFAPCGHFCCCNICAQETFRKNKKCPLCMQDVTVIVARDMIE
jgi:hypothetical protein